MPGCSFWNLLGDLSRVGSKFYSGFPGSAILKWAPRIPDRGPNDFFRPPKMHSGCPDNFGWTKPDQTTNDFSRVPKII